MPTNITDFVNTSAISLIAFNSENVSNSFWVKPKTSNSVSLWISYHEDKPLILSTRKGVCKVWDSDWKIRGRWEGSTNEIIFLEDSDNGVGGDVRLHITTDGDITIKKFE